MREQYWKMYISIKHRSLYYKNFQVMFSRVNWALSSLCAIASLSCVAAWGIWGTHPVLWSLIICATQIFQALFPKLPYNDLLVSTRFMICSLDKLLLDIEHSWLDMHYVHDLPDEKILSLIHKYETSYSNLVSQFFAGTFLPDIKYLAKKSEKECKTYIETKYSITEEVQNTNE